MYEDRKRPGCSVTGSVTPTVPALPLSVVIMCFLQTIHYFSASDYLGNNLSPSFQSPLYSCPEISQMVPAA